jgi:16S rRNA (guanine(966)-N(2))-methyltransferase RsmD
VRITGGSLRGRIIDAPAGYKARPTTDLARESLLNILNNRYDFSAVNLLDLFSGTGAISYEFASRGTEDIDLVEIDRRNCEFISKTARKLGISKARVHRLDVRDFLKACHKQYDIIFADPPYDLAWLSGLPDLVTNSGAFKEESLFILEHPKTNDFTSHPCFSEHRNYGSVNFSFFKKLNSVDL